MKFIQSVAFALFLFTITGCSGIQHVVPETDTVSEHKALAEIQNYTNPAAENSITPVEAEVMLRRTYSKLLPAAQEICEYVDEQETCWWEVEYNAEPTFNAYANEENHVVVFHGVMASVGSEDELAMVLAHEMGHHIADHIDETNTQAATGAVLGAILMGAIAVSAGPCYTYSCQQNMNNAMESTVKLGAAVGSRVYSVEQEKEADFLAAFILDRSGYDLLESRQVLVKLGAMSEDTETSFLASHPAGPERLASYDSVIELVYFDDDGMPDKEANSSQ